MVKLRFAVRKFEPFERHLEACWKAYQEAGFNNVEMEFVPMDLEELYSAMFTHNGLQSGEWDLVHLNTDWLAEAYQKNGISELNSFLEAAPPSGGAAAWSPSLMDMQTFDGRLYGLPFHDGPECLVIRKDLFESAAEQQHFRASYDRELTVPKDWNEFLQVAEFFHRPDENLYGTVFAGYPDGHNAVFDFCLQLWSRGGELQATDGAIQLQQAAAIQALDFYRNLFKRGNVLHPQSLSYESVQAGEAFARGEVAMMVNWFGFASWAQIDALSSVRGKVDIAAIPAEEGIIPPSLNVYWLYTLAEGSRHKNLAYDFLRYAVSAQNDKKLTLAGGVGCRYSTWFEAEVNERIDFYSKLGPLHETARTLPRLANWPAIAHIIDEMVNLAVQTEHTSGTLLEEAQIKINLLT
ncbi:extracellular solute-binding protein [Sphingobacterium griseoflavum]|uniref:ABC transporter substrate-binding protein n=1 Tax=Sphingobacterium griseoflavum TaxID=1474952 RepID=A0ABQ3I239_9SPHI|nr:extracellular solute-binding protein [Sphingobacterium griseoflavum]GHE47088.1 hypothetical protein GCM10017764_32850 [Sphingobacterium griseoflavum]